MFVLKLIYSVVQKGQPLADKIVLNLFLATFVCLIFFIPLMGGPRMLVSVVGLVLIAAGWWVIVLALHENTFAAPVVKHQEERDQRVIDSGLYATVRHPMYMGFVPFIVGVFLWLGSYAAALLTIVPIGVMVVRIIVEERFLRRELEGYGAYTERTRYRLIPFLW